MEINFDDVLAALSDGMSFRRMQRRVAIRSVRDIVRSELATKSARTPKVKDRFHRLVKAGKVKIVHRRFKPPQIVILPKSRAKVSA